jgi:hypothetical protein
LRRISYLPPVAGTVFTSFKGHLMTVCRKEEESYVLSTYSFPLDVIVIIFVAVGGRGSVSEFLSGMHLVSFCFH